jgi:hypothetical protein
MTTTVEQLDRYNLVSPEARQVVRTQLEASGVTFEMREETEVVESKKTKGLRTVLYVLAVKRVSPTLKQLLSASTKVPLT